MATMAFKVMVDIEFTPYFVGADPGPPIIVGVAQTDWGELEKLIDAGCTSQGFSTSGIQANRPSSECRHAYVFDLVEL